MSKMKTILITGATSGIGLETARYLIHTGYSVVLVGRNEDKLKEISLEMNDADYIVCDLENTDSIEGIFKECLDRKIKLDGMVHSAGIGNNTPIRLVQIEHMEKLMKINYFAFLELCKGFYSRKISNDNSSIVALSSIASECKNKGSVLYSSSKSALNTAISVASKEFIKRKIRVNGLMPANVDTRMNVGLDEVLNFEAMQPMGMIPPENIAVIIEFLLSDKSRYVTGALIPVSAGMEF